MLRHTIRAVPHVRTPALKFFNPAHLHLSASTHLEAQKKFLKQLSPEFKKINIYATDGAGSSGDAFGLGTVKAFEYALVKFFSHTFPAAAFLKPIRQFMGMGKLHHILKILASLRELDATLDLRYQDSTNHVKDAEAILKILTTEGLELIREYSKPVPGMVELAASLEERGILLVLQTAYGDKEAAVFEEVMKKHGVKFFYVVTSDQVVTPRPAPSMINKILDQYSKYPWEALVAGDTVRDMRAAFLAQTWRMGLVSYSALIPSELSGQELEVARKKVAQTLGTQGAHYINDSNSPGQFVAQTLAAIDDANKKMAAGHFPDLILDIEPELKIEHSFRK